MTDRYVVKIERTGSSVVFTGSENACRLRASELNRNYQTDEYKVEPWEESRFIWPSNTRKGA